MKREREYFWDVTLHGRGKSKAEAWDNALEQFIQARIPAPIPTEIIDAEVAE